ncbi:MAG: hypothetical protein EOO64_00085 [Massilia sp.]|nr:MAG: hypothetical protein EOO64_00085 [Massilia sp.]
MSKLVPRLVLLVLFSALCASTRASTADLVGTYATRDNKGVHEVARIEREGDAFVLFDKLPNGSWRKVKQPLVPVTKEQFVKLLNGSPADVPTFDGLNNNGMALFKVPKGWGQGKFKTETGYFMIFALGPIQLEKR